MLRFTTGISEANGIVVAPQDIAGAFAVNAATGKKLWERNEVEAATLVGGGEGVAILSGAMVVAIDGSTGNERWRYEATVNNVMTGPAIVRGGIVYAPMTSGVVALSLADGVEVQPAAGMVATRKIVAREPAKKALQEAGALRWLSEK
jgi:outer membrane protein assembly factor BamB